jgi:hypothetical protein
MCPERASNPARRKKEANERSDRMAKARNPWNIIPAKKRASVNASMKAEVGAKARDLIGGRVELARLFL